MTKPGKGREQEKGAGEEDSGVGSAKLAGPGEAKANAARALVPATIEEVLEAVNKLYSLVDGRHAEYNKSIVNLTVALTEVSKHVSLMEDAAESYERRIKELERWLGSLISQNTQLQAKVDYLEAQSRRQNIRIIGVQEKAENNKLTDFVATLLLKLLGEEHFHQLIKVDHAHRRLAPAKNGRPRAIIARLHHFRLKSWCYSCRERAPLLYDRRPVFTYLDLTSATMRKRQDFQHVEEKCKARKIRCGFQYPAMFVVTVNNSTSTFSTAAITEEFLSREVKDWHLDTV
ncbi:uncharacterized protein tex30 isoform X1 [Hypanus sabinus]|uniref:uncharacterized protein tex30 isoform X1 n=1 Tax=Hypanus sabinus TaxID=79690 RepID=UPI0028C41C57|nr:uncharacterized protein tex30 isoform X1 [Hypanus sabinus]XP_059820701.1 uncharacterized protein tex30 isoform X1 [Hypanus sabinus]